MSDLTVPMRKLNSIYLLTIVALVGLVYAMGLPGSFIFDDNPSIVINPAVKESEISLHTLWASATSFHGGFTSRSIPMASFLIDHAVWGMDPLGFKITSILLHGLNCILLLFFLHRLFQQPALAVPVDWQSHLPGILTLAWAIHPLQVSTVLYVIQRMEIMALTFILLGLILYIHGRQAHIEGRNRSGWTSLALMFPVFILGLQCKETVLLLPVFCLLIELAVFRFAAQSKLVSKILFRAASAATLLAIVAFVFYALPRYSDPADYFLREFTLHERLLTQFRVLGMYLQWIVLPNPNSYLFFYDQYVTSRGLLSPPSTALTGIGILGTIALAIYLIIRRQHNLLALAILLFFASHLLTSNIVPLEMVFEHRNYFAILPVLFAMTWAAIQAREWLKTFPWKTTCIIAISGLFLLTYTRAGLWSDPLAQAMDHRYRNMSSERAGFYLAHEYLNLAQGNPDTPFFQWGIQELIRVGELPGSSPIAERSLIGTKSNAGLPVPEKYWRRLIRKVEAGPPTPNHMRAVTDLLQLHGMGQNIPPEPLLVAGIALLNHRGLSPDLYIEFAILSLSALDDQDQALEILAAASSIAQDPDWDSRAVNTLRTLGYEEAATAASKRLMH